MKRTKREKFSEEEWVDLSHCINKSDEKDIVWRCRRGIDFAFWNGSFGILALLSLFGRKPG